MTQGSKVPQRAIRQRGAEKGLPAAQFAEAKNSDYLCSSKELNCNDSVKKFANYYCDSVRSEKEMVGNYTAFMMNCWQYVMQAQIVRPDTGFFDPMQSYQEEI